MGDDDAVALHSLLCPTTRSSPTTAMCLAPAPNAPPQDPSKVCTAPFSIAPTSHSDTSVELHDSARDLEHAGADVRSVRMGPECPPS
jgi:hypothetical protein